MMVVSAFCLLCIIALFAFSKQFVYSEVTPKWIGLTLATPLITLIYCSVRRNIYLLTKPAIILLILLMSVFIKDWVTIGGNYYLLTYLGCLFLLFFFFQQVVVLFSINYLYGIVILCITALAIYGIFQYMGVLPFQNSNFKVTGNFDNSAGFAAALAGGFPYSLYFLQNTKQLERKISIGVVIVLLIGMGLSGSRTALIASLVVIMCYAHSVFPSIRNTQRIKVFGICLFIIIVTVLYFSKKNSADGRLLIWQCTWNMVQDKPFLGHGYGSFYSKYMFYQAEYFNNHANNKYALLADNISYPFNEYLLILSEHGAIGLTGLLLSVLLLFRYYCQKRTNPKFYAMLGVLSMMIFSFFSYPFKYPFTWIIVLLNVAVIYMPSQKLTGKVSYAIRTGIITTAIGFLCITIPFINAEMTWNKVAKLSLAGKTKNVLHEYNKLHQYLDRNGLFLYNHAAELHYVKEFEKSLSVLKRCELFYNDMDVQMLFADNYMKLYKYDRAEHHLKLASTMCPVRFSPLYQLSELYLEIGRKDEALLLAKHIVNKEVKIPSKTILLMKQKMCSFIQSHEKENVSPNNRSP
ncbi:MAG: O-antigen ligase family protein [Dysgonamonadaceae bacterium]|jgi:O-antigen ligase|nr:O-antigen ligase family protein [Dysgonamonadaceae bacterium]